MPDVLLGEARLDQREDGTGGGRGRLARAVVTQVADVHAEHDRRPFGDGQRAECIHQRALAAGATVGPVGNVGGVLHLARRHADPAQAPLVGQAAAVGLFCAGERRRNGRGAQDGVPAQRVVGHLGQQRRVRPAAERHHDTSEATQLVAQVVDGGSRRRDRGGAHAPNTDSTASSVPTMPA